MSKVKSIPVIDLFAGPGGLAEGFSSVLNKNKRVFDIKLSIEMEENAHKTLELRSFCRQFDPGNLPDEYYAVIEEADLQKREEKKKALFEKYFEESEHAKNEAWHAELGGDHFPPELVDERIEKALDGQKDWLLIGGPPCQAYSMAGRSRVGGIDADDHRVYLYKEYLRIIAKHQPAVFVMENVKGLLSAKVNGERVFEWMLNDLEAPSTVFNELDSKNYKIYSLTTKADVFDIYGKPSYSDHRDYLIKCNKYSIPQKRHRVILLGIREDIDVIPGVITPSVDEVNLGDVIGDLPKIRSGLNKRFLQHEEVDGKKKRKYERLVDSDKNWESIVNDIKTEIYSWDGVVKGKIKTIKSTGNAVGSEFMETEGNKILNGWYYDEKLKGVANHVSRSHLTQDLMRYMFSSLYAKTHHRFPRLHEYEAFSDELLPDHKSARSGKFADRFRVQLENEPATTVTSHISKDGHYFIHYDPDQCRSLTVREAARIQTFPDNYLFCGSRTAQFRQVGNAVPPYLAFQIGELVHDLMSVLK